MAKLLKNILGESDAPRSKDEKQFYNMHKIEVVKNLSEPTKDDKLFNATNIKTTSRKPDRHGYEPGEDLSKYDAGRATVPGTMKPVMGKQFAPTTTYESENIDEMLSGLRSKGKLKYHEIHVKGDAGHKIHIIRNLGGFGEVDAHVDHLLKINPKLKIHVNSWRSDKDRHTSPISSYDPKKHDVKEDVKEPVQSNLTDKVFKDENNSHTQTKKKQKPHVNYYDGGSAKQVARMVAKHRANEETVDEAHSKHQLNQAIRYHMEREKDLAKDRKSAATLPNSAPYLKAIDRKAGQHNKASQKAYSLLLRKRNEETTIDEVSRDTLTSYVKKAISNAGKMASGKTDYNRNRPNATETPFDRPLKNREQGVKTAFKKAAGIAKVNMKEDQEIDEGYDPDFHFHQDQFLNHNRLAVEANQKAKQFKSSGVGEFAGGSEDPDRDAMHDELANAYAKIATQHLKMASHHARKSGIKSR